MGHRRRWRKCRRAPGNALVLTFQQFYRDIRVQCEIEGRLHAKPLPGNPAILEFADYLLNGT